jgi:PRTRC genetic system ThiF family protein
MLPAKFAQKTRAPHDLAQAASMLPYTLPERLTTNPVSIDLVGCGGTGCQILTGLARLNATMLALGHPGGLSVTVWDPDTVTEANLARQLFAAPDVGQYKADVLVNRVNLFFGLDWRARAARFAPDHNTAFVITCVDSGKTRADIGEMLSRLRTFEPVIWLDTGNDRDTGQAVWGVVPRDRAERRDSLRLPTVLELFPELGTAATAQGDRQEPSCSLAQAIERQSLFVNQAVATWALNALFRAFRYGGLTDSAWFLSLSTGAVTALPIDPIAWKRFGHDRAARPPRKPQTRKGAKHKRKPKRAR